MGGSRKVFYLFLAALTATLSMLCGSGRGQEPQILTEPRTLHGAASTGHAERIIPQLRVNSDLVLVPVTVTDSENRLVMGLGKEQFKLYDNKVEQVITHFTREDAPASIALVFDCSGSMGPKLEKSRAAVAEFIRTANPQDEFSLVTFNNRVNLAGDFQTGTSEIENRLLFMTSHGETALLDAICLAMNEMKHAKYARKAILIISDGGDNASRFTVRELKNWVREADVQIYSIGIFESPSMRGRSLEELNGPALLNDIAKQTGGRLFEVYDLDSLRSIAAKISDAIRNQYVLGFSPAAEHDGKYHGIEVKIPKGRGLPSLHATFRSGYYAR